MRVSSRRLRLTAPAVVLLSLALLGGCAARPPMREFRQKLVILGFDGLDPTLVERWMGEGKLPNLARLARAGTFRRLESTNPSESPTAWASFATGVNPGKHNIYDFLVRDFKTYLPDLNMVRREEPRFLFGFVPIRRPHLESTRGGTSFWVTAARGGVRSTVLTVPVTFPPETVPGGELLSGLPLPDIRGTVGTFYYFASDLSRYEEGNTEFGGILKRLIFDGDRAESVLTGPPNPIVRQRERELRAEAARAKSLGAATPSADDPPNAELAALQKREDVDLPLAVHWDRQAKAVSIDLDGQTIRLKEHQWSDWIPLEFRVNFLVRLHGLVQIYLAKADQDVQIYVSPVNWDPARPPLPISAPPSFSNELVRDLGIYRTLGWAEATWGLNEDRIDEATFMDDLNRAFDDRARVILDRIGRRDWSLLVGVIESTDRVQHMFWRLTDPAHPMYDKVLAARFGDAIERVYRRSDAFVGEVLTRIDPDTVVMVVSDHGFHSFRKAVNLNTWLVENGFMTLVGQQEGQKYNLNDLFSNAQFWATVDWSRTKAYSMGLGQIYLNLRGREAKGIVSPGEYRAVQDAIAAKLLELKDPETGTPIVHSVDRRDDMYRGEYLNNAPDLQVGFVDGYRVSWQTTLGGVPAGILYPNMKKWSGDHCSFDYRLTAGTFITNRAITTATPRIIDIAPTALAYFGLTPDADLDGHSIY